MVWSAPERSRPPAAAQQALSPASAPTGELRPATVKIAPRAKHGRPAQTRSLRQEFPPPLWTRSSPWTRTHRAGKTALNGSGTFIRQTIENDTLSWTEPETVRFARLETKAVQRPHFGPWSVSVVRMVPPNPFETTRKFGVAGVAIGVCDGKMAEGVGFEPTVGFHPRRFSRPVP